MKAITEYCQEVRECKAVKTKSCFNTIFTIPRTWRQRGTYIRNKKPRISASGKVSLKRDEVLVF